MIFKKNYNLDHFNIISTSSTDPTLSGNLPSMLNRGPFVSRCPPPHLAADTESLQRVEAEPARVSCLSEAVHELCVERPLQGRQTHQDHMFLFRGKLVPQNVMTSSRIKKSQSVFVKIQNRWVVSKYQVKQSQRLVEPLHSQVNV